MTAEIKARCSDSDQSSLHHWVLNLGIKGFLFFFLLFCHILHELNISPDSLVQNKIIMLFRSQVI